MPFRCILHAAPVSVRSPETLQMVPVPAPGGHLGAGMVLGSSTSAYCASQPECGRLSLSVVVSA